MDTFTAVRTLLATRQFRDGPVPEDVVREILEAGRLSASSMNAQPWHFVLVRERATLKQLGDLAKTGPYTARAALAIVACTSPSKFGVSDLSRAIQSMMLVAWSHGVASNWVGFGDNAGIRVLLGIPDDLQMLAMVPMGYPAEARPGEKKKRKALDEIVSSERFENPYS